MFWTFNYNAILVSTPISNLDPNTSEMHGYNPSSPA